MASPRLGMVIVEDEPSEILILLSIVPMQYYVRRDFAIALTIIATVLCYFTMFVYDSAKATSQLGIVCNFFTIIFFAAPLATMVRNYVALK